MLASILLLLILDVALSRTFTTVANILLSRTFTTTITTTTVIIYLKMWTRSYQFLGLPCFFLPVPPSFPLSHSLSLLFYWGSPLGIVPRPPVMIGITMEFFFHKQSALSCKSPYFIMITNYFPSILASLSGLKSGVTHSDSSKLNFLFHTYRQKPC